VFHNDGKVSSFVLNPLERKKKKKKKRERERERKGKGIIYADTDTMERKFHGTNYAGKRSAVGCHPYTWTKLLYYGSNNITTRMLITQGKSEKNEA
jgi:hypothetical protein